MNRPHLLFCTSRFPYPVIAGYGLRVFNLTSQLAKFFDITLVCLGTPPSNDVEEFKARTGILEVHCIPHGRITSLLGALKALLTGMPLQVGYYTNPDFERMIRELTPKVDIGIFHLIRTSSAWKGNAGLPVVLEMCDAISANFSQTAKEGAWWSPWRIISAVEAPRTLRFERAESKRFNLITMHAHKDAAYVGIPESHLLVSTQGVNLAELPYKSPKRRSGRSIVLIGKMDFFPNWHGAEWFAKAVLPLLPHDVTLKVVGDCSIQIRSRLEALPRVVVTGRVESLSCACDDAFAAIAPMQVATGIQNKVLEYFAMGLPSIVSPSVASGLLPSAQGVCHSATTPQDWSAAINYIASDLDAAERMTQLARDYAYREHSWDRIGEDYVQRLQQLLT
jgi:glycosyltransferase involved in cell wall biosynthesis